VAKNPIPTVSDPDLTERILASQASLDLALHRIFEGKILAAEARRVVGRSSNLTIDEAIFALKQLRSQAVLFITQAIALLQAGRTIEQVAVRVVVDLRAALSAEEVADIIRYARAGNAVAIRRPSRHPGISRPTHRR
jgi:hypothetical protein